MMLPWLQLLIFALIFGPIIGSEQEELKIEVISKPDDCDRVTEETDLVYIHFTSYYGNGTEIESSYEQGEPMYVPLGRGKVIQGLDDALVGMCMGEIRKLVIPPHLGYGEKGYKRDTVEIPPNETLIMEVEMIFHSDVDSVHEVFSTLDIDDNQKLDEEEIEFTLKSYQYLPTNILTKKMDAEQLREKFAKAFKDADIDNDSNIDFDEFMIANGLKDPPAGPVDVTKDEELPEPEGPPLKEGLSLNNEVDGEGGESAKQVHKEKTEL